MSETSLKIESKGRMNEGANWKCGTPGAWRGLAVAVLRVPD